MVRWNARPRVSLLFWLFWHCCRWPSSRETCYVWGSQPHPTRPNGQTCHWKPRCLRSFRNKPQKVQFWKTCKFSALWILNMNIIWYVLIHWIGIVNVIPTSPYLKWYYVCLKIHSDRLTLLCYWHCKSIPSRIHLLHIADSSIHIWVICQWFLSSRGAPVPKQSWVVLLSLQRSGTHWFPGSICFQFCQTSHSKRIHHTSFVLNPTCWGCLMNWTATRALQSYPRSLAEGFFANIFKFPGHAIPHVRRCFAVRWGFCITKLRNSLGGLLLCDAKQSRVFSGANCRWDLDQVWLRTTFETYPKCIRNVFYFRVG